MIRIYDDKKLKCYRIPISDQPTEAERRVIADISMLPVQSRQWVAAESEWRVNYSQKKAMRAIYMRRSERGSVAALTASTYVEPAGLRDTQREALAFCAKEPSALLDMYMSTGKTRTGIELVRLRQAARALIVCPTGAMAVWRDQLAEWATYDYSLCELSRNLTVTQRAAKLRAFMRDSPASAAKPNIVVVNHQAVWRDALANAIDGINWDMFILDESHHSLGRSSRVGKFFGKIAMDIPYRYAFSGTPLRTDILDAFGIYRFLQPAIFGRNYQQFQQTYAEVDHMTRKVLNYRNQDDFNRRYNLIRYHAGRNRLNIEEPEIILQPVRLPASVWRVYKDVEKEFYAELELTFPPPGESGEVRGGVVDAPNVLVKYLRLQQIESEFVATEDGTVQRLTPGLTAKQEILRDFLADLPADEKLVVFTRFQLEVDQACAAAVSEDRRVYRLTGESKELEAWKEDKTGAVLVTSLGAGSEAVDMTAAIYAVFWSLSYKRLEFEQAVSRVSRTNQRQAPHIYVMIPEGPNGETSIGRKVYQSHKNKTALIEELTRRA